jgi:hypothetical protein
MLPEPYPRKLESSHQPLVGFEHQVHQILLPRCLPVCLYDLARGLDLASPDVNFFCVTRSSLSRLLDLLLQQQTLHQLRQPGEHTALVVV